MSETEMGPESEAQWWQTNTGTVPKAVKAKLAAGVDQEVVDLDQIEGAEPTQATEDE